MIFNLKLGGENYQVHYITDVAGALDKVEMLASAPLLGFDIETRKHPNYVDTYEKCGLDPYGSFIRLLQFYDGKSTIYVLDAFDWPELSFQQLWKKLSKTKMIAHNAQFELAHCIHNGAENLNIACSMQLGLLVDRAEKSPFEADEDGMGRGFGLAPLSKRFLNIDITKLKKAEQTSDWGAPKLTKRQLAYAAADAVLTYKLGVKFIRKIRKYGMLSSYKLVKDMQHVCAKMQLAGMLADNDKHDELIASWQKKRARAQIITKKHFGSVNLNSSKQLNEWLTEKYEGTDTLKNWPTTDSGAYTFNAGALADMEHLKSISALLSYKKANKLITTYGEKLRSKHQSPITTRYHSSFTIAHTRTGRLSSREPNLQNIPRDSGIRDMFKARDGAKLVVADFSQIEMRVAGELSGDKVIRKAYKDGKDLHTEMAATILDCEPSEVTKEDRQLAKAANFGFLFGMGAGKFGQYAKAGYGIDVSAKESIGIRNAFYSMYAEYVKWCDDQRDRAKKLGYCRTPMGRMRKLLDSEVYTKAVNTPVQGGAAEVMFLSLLEVDRLLDGIKAKLLNCVHDEVIVEADEGYADVVKDIVERSMHWGMYELFPEAPMEDLVEAHIGDTWQEAK